MVNIHVRSIARNSESKGTNDYIVDFPVAYNHVYGIELASAELGPVRSYTLEADTAVAWDEPFLIDVESNPVDVHAFAALGMTWTLWANQVAVVEPYTPPLGGHGPATKFVAIDRGGSPVVLDSAAAAAAAGSRVVGEQTTPSSVVGLSPSGVVLVYDGTDNKVYSVAEYIASASTEPGVHFYLKRSRVVTLPAHLNKCEAGAGGGAPSMVAPHPPDVPVTSLPGGSTVLDPSTLSSDTQYVHAAPTSRQGLLDALVLPDCRIDGSTHHIGGDGWLVGRVGSDARTVPWLLGMTASAVRLPASSLDSPVHLFQTSIPMGVYGPQTLAAALNQHVNPCRVTQVADCRFTDANGREHVVQVLPGIYVDPGDLVRAIANAMTRCQTQVQTTSNDRYEAEAGGIVYPRGPFYITLGTNELAVLLSADEGELASTARSDGTWQLPLAPLHASVRRANTLGPGGVVGKLCIDEQIPEWRHPSIARRLESGGRIPRDRYKWRSTRWEPAAPTTTSVDGDLRLQGSVVRSHRCYMYERQVDAGGMVASTCAPIPLQVGDVARCNDGVDVVVGRPAPGGGSGVPSNTDTPSQLMPLPGMVTVTDGSATITGTGTNFEALMHMHTDDRWVHVEGVGSMNITAVTTPSNSETEQATIAQAASIDGSGSVALIHTKAAHPYESSGRCDGSVVMLSHTWSGATNTAVATLAPLLDQVVPWSVTVRDPTLARRLGFVVGSGRWGQVHVAAYDWNFERPAYVLLCVHGTATMGRHESHGQHHHQHLAADSDVVQMKDDSQVLAKIAMTPHTSMQLNPGSIVQFKRPETVRRLHVSLLHPDLTPVDTHGVENSFTVRLHQSKEDHIPSR